VYFESITSKPIAWETKPIQTRRVTMLFDFNKLSEAGFNVCIDAKDENIIHVHGNMDRDTHAALVEKTRELVSSLSFINDMEKDYAIEKIINTLQEAQIKSLLFS